MSAITLELELLGGTALLTDVINVDGELVVEEEEMPV